MAAPGAGTQKDLADAACTGVEAAEAAATALDAAGRTALGYADADADADAATPGVSTFAEAEVTAALATATTGATPEAAATFSAASCSPFGNVSTGGDTDSVATDSGAGHITAATPKAAANKPKIAHKETLDFGSGADVVEASSCDVEIETGVFELVSRSVSCDSEKDDT